MYFPGVLAGLPFGKLTGERDGFVSAVGLFDKQIIINLFWDIAWVTFSKGQEADAASAASARARARILELERELEEITKNGAYCSLAQEAWSVKVL